MTVVGEELGPPYDRPPLSKGVLTGRTAPADTSLCSAADLAELDIGWRAGVRIEALEVGARQLRLADGTRMGFDRLVVATGATPRAVLLAHGRAGVHVLRTMNDSLALRGELGPGVRLCVIGGGVLGCEIAASARDMGCTVTIVEALPSLMARAVGAGAVAVAVRDLHRDAGVDLVCGTRVVALGGSGRVSAVHTADGRHLAADVVVIALGVEPSVGWLAGSGLTVEDGVVCDEHLAADAGTVFAVGDVARWRQPDGSLSRLEHWTSAVEQAETVAHNLLEPRERWVAHEPVPSMWSDQYGTKIQTLGHPAQADCERVLAADPARHRMLVLHGSAGRVRGAAALGMAGRLMRLRPAVAAASDFEEACRAHAVRN